MDLVHPVVVSQNVALVVGGNQRMEAAALAVVEKMKMANVVLDVEARRRVRVDLAVVVKMKMANVALAVEARRRVRVGLAAEERMEAVVQDVEERNKAPVVRVVVARPRTEAAAPVVVVKLKTDRVDPAAEEKMKMVNVVRVPINPIQLREVVALAVVLIKLFVLFLFTFLLLIIFL